LRRIKYILPPRGVVALLVPAHPSLYGPYDRLDGHFRRYSKADLRRLARSTGLPLLRCRYFNGIGAIGWWVQYRLLKRSIHGALQFRLMNLLIPIVRPLERWLPPPCGLSLVAVLQREEFSTPECAAFAPCGDSTTAKREQEETE